jgi:hypothetical protein
MKTTRNRRKHKNRKTIRNHQKNLLIVPNSTPPQIRKLSNKINKNLSSLFQI